MKFFVGLHQRADAKHFERCFLSINRLRDRKSPFEVKDWILDSGAFTEISTHGHYREPPEAYVEQIDRLRFNGNLLAACSQDYMCEDFILRRTGASVYEHQMLTIERYLTIKRLSKHIHILPVLQGFRVDEYTSHLDYYGKLLKEGAWVGVGSICRRNVKPDTIYEILSSILAKRPDLKLHGFGLKFTSLTDDRIRRCLYSADSLAWSYAARRQGRNQNDWREAAHFVDRIASPESVPPLQRFTDTRAHRA